MKSVSVTRVSATRRTRSWVNNLAAGFLFAFLATAWYTIDGTSQVPAQITKSKETRTGPHQETLHGVHVLWEAPIGSKSAQGIFLVLHGCHHSATDFWLPSVACPECIGLPEEMAIVRMGLDRGLIVVAMSSQNRKSGCWKSHLDQIPITLALQELQQRWRSEEKRHTKLPIIAFGASSGGYLVQQLEHVDAIIAQIAGVALGKLSAGLKFIGFITMQRDQQVERSVKDYMDSISHSDIVKHHLSQGPQALLDTFFMDRIGKEFYSPSQSKDMVHALQNGGFLDSKGHLIEDPRRTNWRSLLQPFAHNDTLVPDASPISEILNVAYGKHEMTRDSVDEMLDECLRAFKDTPS
jgi:hypothetical protein